jgi:tagatose 6-phosphate kinase
MLDKTVEVDAIHRGKIHRSARAGCVVGGKGVNVSRQLSKLGCPTLATGFLGGEIGTMLERLMEAEGIPHEFVRIAGMTREGVTYREPDGSWTAIFEPPHPVSEDESTRLFEKCKGLLDRSSWMVCSGSSPAANADRLFGEIIAEAKRKGVATFLDSYGPPFLEGLAKKPTVVKVNRDEYQQSLGNRPLEDAGFIDALQGMSQRGIRTCLITDGSRPCYALGEGSIWKVFPPQVEAVNATGSGDSMVAGILFGLRERWPFDRCLRFGAAAGAANARKWEVADSSIQEIAALENRILVEQLH